MKPKLAILIPAYNEETRLPQTLESLRQASLASDFPWDLKTVLIVNDGSTDQTLARLRQFQKSWPLVTSIEFRKNCGKGMAVYAGLLHLELANKTEGPTSPEVCDAFLMADADEATPWTQLWPAAQVWTESEGLFLAFGSRRHPQSQILQRQAWWRERLGRIFNQLLRALSGTEYKDTQCGFKLFRPGKDLQQILQLWTVRRFAWDAEVLLNAAFLRLKCVELPISWRHVDASHVHPLKDGLQMAMELVKIRLKHSVTSFRLRRLSDERFDQSGLAVEVKSQVISSLPSF